jgi:hypothetical protein
MYSLLSLRLSSHFHIHCLWLLCCLLQLKDPMFQHSKGHCDVTRYAADYFALKGEHLFGAKSGTGSAAGGKAKA